MHMRKTLKGNQRLQGGHHDDHEHAMRRPEHKHEQHEKKTPFGVSEHLKNMRIRQKAACAARMQNCHTCTSLPLCAAHAFLQPAQHEQIMILPSFRAEASGVQRRLGPLEDTHLRRDLIWAYRYETARHARITVFSPYVPFMMPSIPHMVRFGFGFDVCFWASNCQKFTWM